jgi:SAM-dependent methyltransferase
MPSWAVVFLILAGVLFALKLFYVFAVGGTLPITRGALFVTTSSVRIQTFLDAVPMEAHERFIDLGCGDGRVLRAVHRRYGVTCEGYEVNPFAYLTARALSLGIRNVRIQLGSFWKSDLSDADVVFCYLFPDVMAKLSEKLKQEVKPDSRVVSCNFPLPGWRAEKILRPPSMRHGDPIFVYRLSDNR